MELWERIKLYIRNKVNIDKKNQIIIKGKVKIRNCKIKIRGQENLLEINENTNLNGVNIEIRGENCRILIGRGTIIGKNTYISAREKNIFISIGKNCMLSRNINIMSSDGHPLYQDGVRINPAESIKIEDNIWIADNVTILKGSYISSGSVIGINSLVTKKFKNKNIIIGGNPAKEIKTNIIWKEIL